MLQEEQKKDAGIRRFSHDLRNELGAIYNYAQLLELSLTKKGMEKEGTIARSIAESVKKIDALITEKIDTVNS